MLVNVRRCFEIFVAKPPAVLPGRHRACSSRAEVSRPVWCRHPCAICMHALKKRYMHGPIFASASQFRGALLGPICSPRAEFSSTRARQIENDDRRRRRRVRVRLPRSSRSADGDGLSGPTIGAAACDAARGATRCRGRRRALASRFTGTLRVSGRARGGGSSPPPDGAVVPGPSVCLLCRSACLTDLSSAGLNDFSCTRRRRRLCIPKPSRAPFPPRPCKARR